MSGAAQRLHMADQTAQGTMYPTEETTRARGNEARVMSTDARIHTRSKLARLSIRIAPLCLISTAGFEAFCVRYVHHLRYRYYNVIPRLSRLESMGW